MGRWNGRFADMPIATDELVLLSSLNPRLLAGSLARTSLAHRALYYPGSAYTGCGRDERSSWVGESSQETEADYGVSGEWGG